jgi:hypothetical protein
MVADAILLLNGTDQGMTAVLGKEMMKNIWELERDRITDGRPLSIFLLIRINQ